MGKTKNKRLNIERQAIMIDMEEETQMKRILTIYLTLVLILLLNMTSAMASPEDLRGQVLPDFSVDGINGTTFTLSESLRTHELVLINFWATWCGPCCMEFPSLETAWEQYEDRIDVIALSVEKTDTLDKLTEFADEYNLRFQIGRDDGKMFGSMGGSSIPTTLIVDRDRRVVAVEIGAKGSVEDFTSLFDDLLDADTASDDKNIYTDVNNPEEKTWICSICNAKNSNNDVFCINCAQSRRCPKCGNSVPVEDRFCSVCGIEVEGWKKPNTWKSSETDEFCCNCSMRQSSALPSKQSTGFIDAVNELSGGFISYAEVGGERLVFVVDYMQLQGIDIENFIMLDQYEEELREYSSIIVLMMKDDKAYLVTEMPLTAGKLSEESRNTLMSMDYLTDAALINR